MFTALLPLSLIITTVVALEHIPVFSSISRSNSIISAGWYAGWHATDFPLSQVSWSKYTHLTYSFATTTPDVSTLSLAQSDEALLPEFVSAAHKQSVNAILSIGGWTGSRWFSSNVRSADNRTAFVKTVLNLAKHYKLDGLEFDWEYPAFQGIGCNTINLNDTNNFLAFLQELRNSTGTNLILSATTVDTTWIDSANSTSTDVSQFSKVLDYIIIMNYDVKSNPAVGAGPTSPLDDSCAPMGARFGSAMSAVAAWTNAGMPASQIVLGVPAYGHSFVIPTKNTVTLSGTNSSSVSLYPHYTTGEEKPGDRWDGTGGLDVCALMEGPGGIFTYWGLMEEGFLNEDGSAVNGIEYMFDNCSQTPFLYKPSTGIYISYENPQSFAVKGGFIRSAGLKGFAIWEAGGDSNDSLLDSILNGTQNGGPYLTKPNTQGSGTSSTSFGFSVSLEGYHWSTLVFMIILAWNPTAILWISYL